ncbi:hypothetical protein MNEG_4986 [Monoraphidium neglectum]|jgi:hypothetical protein|uniref:Uncharacterized protein n=1 Tax=Monoraphidium neglectum TaxID=145388 RepID=A0A0D2NBY8_9CHLO|nr:hypothetical protein MNEG_4986 [Monoraphidium neglectum]KIZ02971.1 hypothetical protein MNEG_4986 [Monoraphidium neglectum]|eukprot:XP_013901990.1 hypothetical protein MNEG_4986 [Monoraphidium neglectum]
MAESVKRSVSFSSNYPFPCLLWPEDEEPGGPADDDARSAAEPEDEGEQFELDEFFDVARERSSASIRPKPAVAANGQPLVRP